MSFSKERSVRHQQIKLCDHQRNDRLLILQTIFRGLGCWLFIWSSSHNLICWTLVMVYGEVMKRGQGAIVLFFS